MERAVGIPPLARAARTASSRSESVPRPRLMHRIDP